MQTCREPWVDTAGTLSHLACGVFFEIDSSSLLEFNKAKVLRDLIDEMRNPRVTDGKCLLPLLRILKQTSTPQPQIPYHLGVPKPGCFKPGCLQFLRALLHPLALFRACLRSFALIYMFLRPTAFGNCRTKALSGPRSRMDETGYWARKPGQARSCSDCNFQLFRFHSKVAIRAAIYRSLCGILGSFLQGLTPSRPSPKPCPCKFPFPLRQGLFWGPRKRALGKK